MARALTLAATLAVAGCGWKPIAVRSGAVPAPAVEGDRIAEARVALPDGGTFLHDIWYAGVFETAAPIDLAVLREYCRPGQLVSVTEQHMPLFPTMTGEIYTPRLVTFSCGAP